MSSRGTRCQELRKSNLAKKYSQSNQGITTVMIRNIPKEYSQDELIEEVSAIMGHEPFDFFYLPWDFQHNANVGYAFVNFHRTKSAHLSMKLFAKYQFKAHPSAKLGDASPAHIQGLENNLRHLEHRAVVHENHPCSPVVMWKGQKIELSVIFQVMRSLDGSSRVKQPRSMLVAGSFANLGDPDGQYSDQIGNTNDGFAHLLDLAVGLMPDSGVTPAIPGGGGGGGAAAATAGSGPGGFTFGPLGGSRGAVNLGGMQMHSPGALPQVPGGRMGHRDMQVEDIFEQNPMDREDPMHGGVALDLRPGQQLFQQPMSWPMSQRNHNPGFACANRTQQYYPQEPLLESVSGERSGEGGGYMYAAEALPSSGCAPAQGAAAAGGHCPAYVSLPQGLPQRQPMPHSGGAPGSTGSHGAPLPPGLFPDAGPTRHGSSPGAAHLPPEPVEQRPPDQSEQGVREIRVPRSQEDALQKYLRKFGDM